MNCIYCLGEGKAATGVAHALPEALRKNDMVLPEGAACDECNNYLGKLDGTLVAHPIVSLGIQALKLPGKAGRMRHKVGNVSRTDVPGAITIPTGPPEYRYGPDGRTILITPLVDRSFDELRFRRALHHLAMNVVAWKEGPLAVLGADFDPVRKYLRQPERGEAWPFAQLLLLNDVSPVIDIIVRGTESRFVVAMRLLAGIFCVDLYNSGELKPVIDEERKKYPEIRYVGEDERLPRNESNKSGRQYRISIYDEDAELEEG